MRMAADRRDIQPTGSLFVGEIDHEEIKHIEVNSQFFSNLSSRSPYFGMKSLQIIKLSFALNTQVVGKGAFGTVYKAVWRETFVAVKYIEPETERNAFRIEVKIIFPSYNKRPQSFHHNKKNSFLNF